MKQFQINKAYGALNRLLELKFPIKKSREIYILTNKLKEHCDFGAKEEVKIIQSYDGIINDNGSFNFDGENRNERAQKCISELQQLSESEIEIDFKTIIINETDYGIQTISPADIGNLEGFIIFE